jgi:hypothetical protein
MAAWRHGSGVMEGGHGTWKEGGQAANSKQPPASQRASERPAGSQREAPARRLTTTPAVEELSSSGYCSHNLPL